MTKEDVIVMFTMRVNGSTFDEIGKEFGVTRERIRQILEANTKDPAMKGMKKSAGCKCIYPALADWMVANCCPAYKLRKESGVCKSMTTLYYKLQGRNPFNLDEIKKLLAYTGMTFEEAFWTVETDACEQ